jgi:hypothetical protein
MLKATTKTSLSHIMFKQYFLKNKIKKNFERIHRKNALSIKKQRLEFYLTSPQNPK